jgi:hypothetical protein
MDPQREVPLWPGRRPSELLNDPIILALSTASALALRVRCRAHARHALSLSETQTRRRPPKITHRKHAADCPYLAWDRRVLVQRQVRASLVVVSLIRLKQMTKVLFAKDNHVVKTIPSDRTNEPLPVSILPWRSRRDRPIAYAHRPNAPNEGLAIGRIPVANEISWRP